MARTCVITTASLPSEVTLGVGKTHTFDVKFSNANGSIEVDPVTQNIPSTSTGITATYSSGKVTITAGAEKTNGVITLKTKATGEASWEYHILVVVE